MSHNSLLLTGSFYTLEVSVIVESLEKVSFDYSILCPLEGSLTFTLDQSIVAEPGWLIFAHPSKAYRLTPSDGSVLLASVHIRRDYLHNMAQEMGYARDRELYFLHTSSADFPELRQQILACVDEVRTAAAGYRIALDALLAYTTVLVLRNLVRCRLNPQLELSRVGLVDRRLRRAVEYIHAHYSKDLSLSEIAAEAFLSEYHFARLFKKVFGFTPHNYLAALRIEQARKLLYESDLSIAEVSACVGYSSQSHFTKVFREQTGFTPAEFRMLANRSD